MKYKEAITKSMEMLAADPKTIFLGYCVKYGNKAAGTLKNVSEDQLFETPVAENLMAGLGIGLSLEGYLPVVFFERFDFVLNALDAIINHLDKIEAMSSGEFVPRVIIRVVVGNTRGPLFTGLTHTQDFTEALSKMTTSLPVMKLPHNSEQIMEIYQKAGRSCVIVEEKDAYEIEC